MSDEIRNCEFRFKCPKTWDSLQATEIETQRFCGTCQTIVHHCRTATELQWTVARNFCVAVEVEVGEDESEVGMGSRGWR